MLSEFLFPLSLAPQPVAVRWRTMFEIALGLRYLRNAGIVHGDVHSSRVWLGQDFKAKLDCSDIQESPRLPRRHKRTLKKEVSYVDAEHEDHVLRQRVVSGALSNLSSVFSDAQASLLHRMCSIDLDDRPLIAEVEEEFRAAGFDTPFCELATVMRSAHDRNVYYGLMPTLSAVVRPNDEWISPSSEVEAAKSFRGGLVVVDGFAPELATGGSASQASDTFELGILIAVMVSGQSWRDLYPCPAPPCVIGSWIRSNVLPPKPDAFTEAEWELVKRMCALDPSARVSISTVVAELGKILDDATRIEQTVDLPWDPDHTELPGDRISVTDALTKASNLLSPRRQENPGTAGARWILRRLQDIDRVLGMDTQPRQIPLSIVRIYGDTLASLLKLLKKEDADSSFSDQYWSGSVSATYGRVHAMHWFIDHVLNELRLPRSTLNTHLHDWRQQWELEQHSQVRRIASTESREQPPLEEPTPEWLWPPYTITNRRLPLLGAGGFGAAYAARWLDTPVVVKRVVILNERDRERFQHEVDLWYQLNHPHVIQLFGACHVGDNSFFVCEHATNRQLDEYLKRDESMRVQTSWKRLWEASLRLLYLHADLKCDNTLISGDEKAKVADFGLSFDIESQSTLNCSQKSLAAVQWRAPEALRGEKPTFASDVFSFGMRIYQAVSGQRPWGSAPSGVVKAQVLDGKLPQRPSVFTDGQWEFVQQMCCFDPRDRLRVADVVPILRQIIEWNSLLTSLFLSEIELACVAHPGSNLRSFQVVSSSDDYRRNTLRTRTQH